MISMRTEFLARTGASISSSQIRTATAMRTDAMIATRADGSVVHLQGVDVRRLD
jgi:hypothetical protein